MDYKKLLSNITEEEAKAALATINGIRMIDDKYKNAFFGHLEELLAVGEQGNLKRSLNLYLMGTNLYIVVHTQRVVEIAILIRVFIVMIKQLL